MQELTVSSQGKRARVVYDYEKDEANELALTEGQVVTNIEMLDEGWWSGTGPSGESGLFPSNYVELIEEEEGEARTVPPPPPPPARAVEDEVATEETGPQAIAMYDYEAAEEGELSFAEGDLITHIEFVSDDWWQGVARNETGVFPANYVELKN